MKVTVIRHVPFEDVGYLGDVLRGSGHSLTYCDLGQSVDLDGARALILMGGPMSVNDPDAWVTLELKAIERALKAALPVLGICLGAQLIARALGGSVKRNPV